MNTFAFKLGDSVIIKASGETAEVVSRAEHATAEPSYYLRYCRADGHAVEQWWSQSALQPNEIKVSNEIGTASARVTDGCAIAPRATRLHPVVAATLANRMKELHRNRDNLCEVLSHVNADRNATEKRIEEVSEEIAALDGALSGR